MQLVDVQNTENTNNMKGQSNGHADCRFSAIIQMIFGFVLVIFGVADRTEFRDFESGFPAKAALGIWMGMLVSQNR